MLAGLTTLQAPGQGRSSRRRRPRPRSSILKYRKRLDSSFVVFYQRFTGAAERVTTLHGVFKRIVTKVRSQPLFQSLDHSDGMTISSPRIRKINNYLYFQYRCCGRVHTSFLRLLGEVLDTFTETNFGKTNTLEGTPMV